MGSLGSLDRVSRSFRLTQRKQRTEGATTTTTNIVPSLPAQTLKIAVIVPIVSCFGRIALAMMLWLWVVPSLCFSYDAVISPPECTHLVIVRKGRCILLVSDYTIFD